MAKMTSNFKSGPEIAHRGRTVTFPPVHFFFKQAYTFVELLVTVSVIGGLLAISFPTLAHFKVKSHSVQCRHNLRQIIFSYRLYVVQNNGFSPSPVLDSGDGSTCPHCCRHKRGPCPSHRPDSPAKCCVHRHGIPHSDRFAGFDPALESSHNLAGMYVSPRGFLPQGLGRLLAGGQLTSADYLYCPTDPILESQCEITGLGRAHDSWLFKYPLQTSYIARPVGLAQEIEADSALKEPFDANPGHKALVTEVSCNHPDGVHVARVNGSVGLVPGVRIYGLEFTAFGLTTQPRAWVQQRSYRFDFRLSPWIWLALDEPERASQIVAQHPPLFPGCVPGPGDDDQGNEGNDGKGGRTPGSGNGQGCGQPGGGQSGGNGTPGNGGGANPGGQGNDGTSPSNSKGNNGVGNGEDGSPPGKAPENDSPGSSPGNPDARTRSSRGI